MTVKINGNETAILVNDSNQLKEAIQQLSSEGKYVNTVLLNGEEKTITFILDKMTAFEMTDLIEIVTCTLDELIESIMSTSSEVLPNLYHLLSQVTEHLRIGDVGLGASEFSDVISVLQWHLDVLDRLSSLHEEPSTLHDFYEQLSSKITELAASWENEDFVLLSDLIQYELTPWVEQWFGFVQLFQKQMMLEKMKKLH